MGNIIEERHRIFHGGLYTHEVNEALELVARAEEMMDIPEVVLGRQGGAFRGTKNMVLGGSQWMKLAISWEKTVKRCKDM